MFEKLEPTDDRTAEFRAVADLYHGFFTGIMLTIVTRKGVEDAAEFTYRMFRTKHHEQFLPGLKKLGIDDLPPAVASAQFHYLANQIGEVGVEYMYESDRKAWIRYPPPRYAWDDAAIAGIPTAVNRAMLRGWHGNNGISLGNPRLGFVCTKMTMDGQSGLEGYWREFDHDLDPEDRVRYARSEEGPEFDPDAAPTLPSQDWPEERQQKALRNFGMDWWRSMTLQAIELFGPLDGRYLSGLSGTLIGLHYYERTTRTLGISGNDADTFAQYMLRMARGQGEDASMEKDGDAVIIRQSDWRMMQEHPDPHPVVFEAWNGLWEGLLSSHNPRLRLDVLKRMDLGDDCFEWRISRRRPSTIGRGK
ncbi:MAG: hypothetical protein JRF65_10625 [Deltaproteobacteria bacterium]|nr:hypothetical protein [Deltaproteobacteria bacterium]